MLKFRRSEENYSVLIVAKVRLNGWNVFFNAFGSFVSFEDD